MIIEPTQFIALFTCRFLPSFSIPYIQYATEKNGEKQTWECGKVSCEMSWLQLCLANRLVAESVKGSNEDDHWHKGLIHIHA